MIGGRGHVGAQQETRHADPTRTGTTGRTTTGGAPPGTGPVEGTVRAGARPRVQATGTAPGAAVLLLLAGVLGAGVGIVSFAREAFWRASSADLVVHAGWTAWGWVHLLLGVVLVACGLALLARYEWGRILGVVAAATAVVVNLAFVGAYPEWTLPVVAVDLAAVWASSSCGRVSRYGR